MYFVYLVISLMQSPYLFTVSSCCFIHSYVRDGNTVKREICCAAEMHTVDYFCIFVHLSLLHVFFSESQECFICVSNHTKGSHWKVSKDYKQSSQFSCISVYQGWTPTQVEALQELIRILRRGIPLLLKILNSCEQVQHGDGKPEEVSEVPAEKLFNEYYCTTRPSGPAKLLLQQEA